MGAFMQRRAMPVDGLEEGLGRRHHHIVRCRRVVSPVAANTKVDSACPDQRIDRGLDQPGLGRRHGRHEVLRQAVTLSDIENREALQERDRLGFVAGLSGTPAFIVRHESVGINDGGATLALADIAAKRQGLAKRKPALAREAMTDHSAPEDQHIDAGIAAFGGRVPRHGEGRLGRRCPPGLNPGKPASLQLGEDPTGDFVIEARPVQPQGKAFPLRQPGAVTEIVSTVADAETRRSGARRDATENGCRERPRLLQVRRSSRSRNELGSRGPAMDG